MFQLGPFVSLLAVAGLVALILVPIPTPVVDALLALNIAVAVILLLSTLSAPSMRSLTSLPRLLLLTTVVRLALNISTTRLILSQADAGGIVAAFGSFVVSGSYLVGGVIFAILTIVQFVVISSGGSRVAEVAARFALDSLPGEQNAIDADLKSGSIGRAEAERRREALTVGSRLAGHMDGAMRFVRGDAIAGLLITAVNLVAGVTLGTTTHGMSAEQALTTYGLLTIGDGLAAQIPAVLVSVAAAFSVLLIEDPRSPSSLPEAVAQDLGRTPANVVGAGALLIGLGLVPGMPAAAFVTTGAGTALVGWLLSRRPAAPDPAAPELGAAPRLEVRVGLDLARCLGGPSGVARQVDDAVRTAADAVRWPPPAVLHAPTPATGPDSWHLDLDGVPAATGVLDPSTPTTTATAFVNDFRAAVAGLLPELADVQTTADLIDALAETHPALVREALAGPLSLPSLAQLLASLMADGLAAGDLRTVLDAVLSSPATVPSRASGDDLAEAIRPRFQRQLTALAMEGRTEDVVEAFTLDENLLFGFEDLVAPLSRANGAGAGATLPFRRTAPPTLRRDVQRAALQSLGRATLPRPILFTPPPIRRLVRDALGARWQHLMVLCADDLDPAVSVEPAGALTTPSEPAEAS